MNQVKNTVVCKARLSSLNGHISSNVDTMYQKLSTHAILRCSFISQGQNIKILKMYFMTSLLRYSIGWRAAFGPRTIVWTTLVYWNVHEYDKGGINLIVL